jgi:hypothetical protein
LLADGRLTGHRPTGGRAVVIDRLDLDALVSRT